MTYSKAVLASVIVALLVLTPICLPCWGTPTRWWGTERIAGYCVWDNNDTKTIDPDARAGQGVTVAIIDTGVDYRSDVAGYPELGGFHEDLAENIIGGNWCLYVNDPSNPNGYRVDICDHDWYDEIGHGTKVAGIVAATGAGHNGSGILGVAPRASIWCLKYNLYAFMYAYRWEKEVVAAINYSSTVLHAQIIVMAFGSDQPYDDLHRACLNAYGNGSLLVAATDNNVTNIVWPAAYDDCVVAVGATDINDMRASWSRVGPEVDYVAPGVSINSTYGRGERTTNYEHNSYMVADGNSLACADVAGAAALLWSSKNVPDYDGDGDGWENYEVNATLRQFVLDLGAAGRDDEYGYGLVNAWKPNQRPIGDVNCDLHCDVQDLYLVGRAYNSEPGMPNWARRCDINIDNYVDVADYYVVVQHYGQDDP